MLRLMLQSGLFKTRNPRLINKSGFKSRAAYDGARTVSKKLTMGSFHKYPKGMCGSLTFFFILTQSNARALALQKKLPMVK